MQLVGGDILTHLESVFANDPKSFPRHGTMRYPEVLRGWIGKVEADLLPHVTAAAVSIDGGRLTAHDVEHVRRVRAVAARLLQESRHDLTPYELVFLLLAIYLHDLGNALGREGHERRAKEVLKAGGAALTLDGVEIRTAQTIARAHGGRHGGSKDTIGVLPEEQSVWSETVRTRLVAAVLRLADELADDPARADRVGLASGTLPPGSEVYHRFAIALHSQVPNGRERTILLKLDVDDHLLFRRALGKNEAEVQFLDEIFERTLKTYREARYCSRFMRPFLDFERVRVEISIFEDDELVRTVAYTIAETGYGDDGRSIYDLSPELERFEGERLTAERLAGLLAGAEAGSDAEGATS